MHLSGSGDMMAVGAPGAGNGVAKVYQLSETSSEFPSMTPTTIEEAFNVTFDKCIATEYENMTCTFFKPLIKRATMKFFADQNCSMTDENPDANNTSSNSITGTIAFEISKEEKNSQIAKNFTVCARVDVYAGNIPVNFVEKNIEVSYKYTMDRTFRVEKIGVKKDEVTEEILTDQVTELTVNAYRCNVAGVGITGGAPPISSGSKMFICIESSMNASSIDDVTTISFLPDGADGSYTPIIDRKDNVLTMTSCERNKCKLETLAVPSLFTSESQTVTCTGSVNLKFESRKLDETFFGARSLQSSEESAFEVVIKPEDNIYKDDESCSFMASNIVLLVSLFVVMFLFV